MLRVALQITSTAFSRWTLAPDVAIHAVKQNSSLYEIPDLIDEVAGLLGCLGLSREADLKIITLPFGPLPFALRPLPFANCLLPLALCLLSFADCPLPFALCNWPLSWSLSFDRVVACLSVDVFHSELKHV